MEQQNVDLLLSLLGKSNFDRLIRSEIFRMLGHFDDCIKELGKFEPTYDVVEAVAKRIKMEAESENSFVALLDTGAEEGTTDNSPNVAELGYFRRQGLENRS
jgi:hypothetical protein